MDSGCRSKTAFHAPSQGSFLSPSLWKESSLQKDQFLSLSIKTVPTPQTSTGRGSSAAYDETLWCAAGINVAPEDLKAMHVSSHHS